MKDLSIQKLETEFDIEAYQQYILQQSIDEFLTGTLMNELYPVTSKVIEYINLPEKGNHLVTKRIGYTHHGIYIGNKQVIQYSGFSGESFNTDDIIPIDKYNRSSIEKVSIESFTQGNGYWIEEHPNTKYTQKEIVERAHQRLGEFKYNLPFNNCEHFANWCIYNTNFSKQSKTVSKVFSKKASDIYHSGKSVYAYVNGDINGKKLLEEIGENVTTSVSMSYYAILGQAVIPIPVVGALAGSLAGYAIGNTFYNSGLFSIYGDSKIVKQSKRRREKIEKISKLMIPVMKENRLKLDLYMEKYFSDRKEIFISAFNHLDIALKSNNSNSVTENLSKINKSYGKELTHNSFNDFSDWIES